MENITTLAHAMVRCARQIPRILSQDHFLIPRTISRCARRIPLAICNFLAEFFSGGGRMDRIGGPHA
jgi:hypothetical protein